MGLSAVLTHLKLKHSTRRLPRRRYWRLLSMTGGGLSNNFPHQNSFPDNILTLSGILPTKGVKKNETDRTCHFHGCGSCRRHRHGYDAAEELHCPQGCPEGRLCRGGCCLQRKEKDQRQTGRTVTKTGRQSPPGLSNYNFCKSILLLMIIIAVP